VYTRRPREPKMEIAAKHKGANVMAIGTRLRQLREQRRMSQGDVEKVTGLLRCYTSRVENGHTVPSPENVGEVRCCLWRAPVPALLRRR
jgi:predicted transcriptional regulator